MNIKHITLASLFLVPVAYAADKAAYLLMRRRQLRVTPQQATNSPGEHL